MAAKITVNLSKINSKIKSGNKMMMKAIAESVLEYGNIYVREDQGTLRDSAYTVADNDSAAAIWDTPYAQRVYYTGAPSKDKNPQASLMWAEKGVKTHKKELQQVAQNAFDRGFGK